MSEGTLLDWTVSVGAEIEEGETVAEVSTDKVDFEVPAPVSGTVLELPWNPGDVIPVGEMLMAIETGAEETSPNAAVPNFGSAAPSSQLAGSLDVEPKPQGIVASPVMRRRAADLGIDLSLIVGSGPGGRILEQDLQSVQTTPQQPQEDSKSKHSASSRVVELTGIRAVVARRMAESARNAAISTTTFSVQADALLAVVDESSSKGTKLTPLPVILSAVARVLKIHHRLNATVEPGADSLRVYEGVDLAVAIATADGLMVPVIRGIDSLGVVEIARALKDLRERARTRKLTPDEVSGGTFTVSSTGGLERVNIVSTLPIINPPQTGTLWVSRITEQPKVVDGVIQAVPTLTASLSFDHRFVDGADATSFINDFVQWLESGDAPA
jgi:pyruvate/2-oxoglutarate dehydrogenase complex dihydrolipoamide acyltransferase (E2) component